MDTKTKNKWLKALRSGEYKQGSGALRETTTDTEVKGGDQYCCLGVLCDIVEPKKWNRTGHRWKNGESENGGFPRGELMKKLGLTKPWTRNEDDEGNDDIAHKLASMNDDGKSFKYIANWIEKRLF